MSSCIGMVVLTLVVSGPATAANVGAEKSFVDPHPLRTTARGPLLRLLDDQSFRKSLELSSSEARALDALLKDADANQTALYRQISSAIRKGETGLPPGAVENRQREYVAALKNRLGTARLKKLLAAGFACWGPPLLLAPGIGDAFGISTAQLRRLQNVDQKAAEELGRKALIPGGLKTDVVDALNLKRNHDLLEMLDSSQRETFDRMSAEGRRLRLDLAVKGETERERAALEPKAKIVLARDRFRALHLIQNDDALDALQIRGPLRAELRSWAKKKTQEETELATILPEESASAYDRQKKLDAFDAGIAAALRSKLGAEITARFWELDLQLRGPAGAFVQPHSAALGVDERQLDAVFAKASQASTAASAKFLPQNLPPDRADAALKEVQKAVEDAMAALLTDRQRAEWKKRCGKPFEKSVLARIARRL